MEYIPPMVGYGILGVTLFIVFGGIKSGWITPNLSIGVRTRNTLQSDESWRIAHEVVSPYLLAGGILSFSFAVILGVMISAHQPKGVLDSVTVVGFVVVLLVVVAGGLSGNSKAKNYNQGRGFY